ncbi:MAG TPA: C25 family cysteine peptidase [Pyrinomonadaceae bacterium]|nr:C25 family cysteine peptidase [Pyrinomonadaceae bacterium]
MSNPRLKIPSAMDAALLKTAGVFVALFALMLFPSATASAQTQTPASPTPISVVLTPYSQDFNTLASTGTSSTLPSGWAFSELDTAQNNTYTAGTGSSTTGDTYSFGSASSTDRAFGGLRSGSLVPTVGAVFKNTTGSAITSITISYTGEQWRRGDGASLVADRIDFQLSTDATSLSTGTWTDHDSLDFSSPTLTPTGAKDGNLVTNRTTLTFTITGLNIANNANFWIRWTDFDVTGSDDGLSVDDFTLAVAGITAVEMADFKATSSKKGVRLEWRTGYEIDNLGFNVYREKKGERVKVNPSIIAGSAFGSAPAPARTAGDSYSWLDPKGSADFVYYLEDIDLAGNLTLHGPITPVVATTSSAVSKSERATLIEELNQKSTAKASAKSSRGWAYSPILTQIPGPATLQTPSKTTSDGFSPQLKQPTSPSDGGFGPSVTSQQLQKVLAAMPSHKLSVRATGWYRVTQQALAAAGFNWKSDLRYLQLYADGGEVPIKINSGKGGGPLQPGDSIEFYGVAADTPFSDTREYWLVAGFKHGQRIKPKGLNGADPGAALQSFEYTVERKERLFYLSGVLNGEAENFFGQVVSSSPATQTLSLHHFSSGATTSPRLELALQGVTVQDHVVKVAVNGTEVGTLSFSDLGRRVQQLPVANGILNEGDNSLTLQSMNGEMDFSLVDYLRLTYTHAYHADNDHLQFTANGNTRVTGFSTANVALLDITDPNSVGFFKPTMQFTGDGFGFTFEASAGRAYLAITEQGAKLVSSITRNKPSAWSVNVPGADLVIVTHKRFSNSVEPLAQLRRNEGLSVAVVDIEDVYDEFSFGAHTPHAIRDFLSWTNTHWERVPRFALLVGDGSYDPRNYLGNGEPDFVPARLVDTSLMETVSDDWFADFDSDAIAEMAIGRLPVRTPAEADLVISKIVNYSPANSVQNALMIADKIDKNNFNFEAATNELSTLLPATVAVQNIFRGDNANSVVHDQIVSGINQGPLLVNYMGHGSVEVWTGAPILSAADATSLTNGNRLPVFLIMTCLNGHYQNPVRESLAESLIRTGGGGAVAVWASSGMTVPEQQLEIGRNLYSHLFGSQPITLGEAIRNAKTTAGIDIRRTWILLGDPSMRIR